MLLLVPKGEPSQSTFDAARLTDRAGSEEYEKYRQVARASLKVQGKIRYVALVLTVFVSVYLIRQLSSHAPSIPAAIDLRPSNLFHYSTDSFASRQWLPVTTDRSSKTSAGYLSSSGSTSGASRNASQPRIAKVTMLYGDNDLYLKAIHSHNEHNERWGYEMYVQRQNMLGGRGYWNKPSYLLSLIVAELGKKEDDRIDWFMWVDADLILINPSIPLDIFLPPASLDGIPQPNFIGNKDHNGLNTGTFFIRVHPWSVHFLAQTLGFVAYNPSIDPGNSIDQYAMARILNETSPPQRLADESADIGWDGTGGSEEQRAAMRVGGSAGEALFQPRVWYNTYEWHHAYEGTEGNLLVHFPGLEDDRWAHMRKWLEEIDLRPQRWDVPLRKTFYEADVGEFWDVVADAHSVFDQGMAWFFDNPYAEENRGGRRSGGGGGAEGLMDDLAYRLRYASDDFQGLKTATGKVRELMDRGKRQIDGRSR